MNNFLLYFSYLCTVASFSGAMNCSDALAESNGQVEEESPFVPEDNFLPQGIPCGGKSENIPVVGVAEDIFSHTIDNSRGNVAILSFDNENLCRAFVQDGQRRIAVCLVLHDPLNAPEDKEQINGALSNAAKSDCNQKRNTAKVAALAGMRCDKTIEVQGKACIEPLQSKEDMGRGASPCDSRAVLGGCGEDGNPQAISVSEAESVGGGTCLTDPKTGKSYLMSLKCEYEVTVKSFGTVQVQCNDCKR